MRSRQTPGEAARAALSATAGAAYRTVFGPGMRLRVRRWETRPAAWPRGFKLRVAAVADPHAGAPGTPETQIERVIEMTNAQEPDLIVLLGDYAASHRFITSAVPVEWTATAFRALRAPLGVYAILGNHDYWDDPEALARADGPTRSHAAFQAAAIPLLENSAVMLDKDGRRFRLAGLGDQYAFPPHLVRRAGGAPRRRDRARRPSWGIDDLGTTLAAAETDAPTILLAHEPDIFPRVPPSVALTLSGHTHGGQIRLAGFPIFTASEFGRRFVYGLVEEHGKALVVSAGIGCSHVPIRVGVRPEITVIDLS